MLRWALRLHKWLALVVAVQVLFWVGGGLVMTLLPIAHVRGEHRLRTLEPPPLQPGAAVPPSLVAGRSGASGLTELSLRSTARGAIWMAHTTDGRMVSFDAKTGLRLPPMSGSEARRLAADAYQGPGEPVSARYLREAPPETGKEGPLWRVDFNDREGTTFYLSPDTAEVISRRSDLWRFYDFMWRLHILDFKSGENFNHPLLIALAGGTLTVTLTGYVLLWVRLRKDLRAAGRRPSAGS